MEPLTEFRTELTEELLVELFEAHEQGGDFRNVTAIRCGVHPRMLKTWLDRGKRGGQKMDIYVRLFLGLARIEVEQRAKGIREILDTTTETQDITMDENGAPSTKVVKKRSVTGVIWYMERRFRQWRADWTPNEEDSEISAILNVKEDAPTTQDAGLGIVRQLAAAMPPEMLKVFAESPQFREAFARQLQETAHGKPQE